MRGERGEQVWGCHLPKCEGGECGAGVKVGVELLEKESSFLSCLPLQITTAYHFAAKMLGMAGVPCAPSPSSGT